MNKVKNISFRLFLLLTVPLAVYAATPAGDNAFEWRDASGGAILGGLKGNGDLFVTGNIDITDASITSAKLASNAVTTSKVAPGAITSDKISAGAVTTNKLSFDTATQSELDTHEGISDAHHTQTTTLAHSALSGVSPSQHHAATINTDASTKCSGTDLLNGSDICVGAGGGHGDGTNAPSGKFTLGVDANGNSQNGTVDASAVDSSTNPVQSNALFDHDANSSAHHTLFVLADGDVTTAKLDTDSVITVKILNQAVTEAKIADGAVTTAKLGNGSVTTGKLHPEALDPAGSLSLQSSGGNVGIGTNSPQAALHLANDDAIFITSGTSSSGTFPVHRFCPPGNNGSQRGWHLATNTSSTGDFQIREYDPTCDALLGTRFAILAGGNVGIGEPAPVTNLEISDSAGPMIFLNDTNGSKLKIEQIGNDTNFENNSADGGFYFGNNGSSDARPSSGGSAKFAINDSSSTSYGDFAVEGDIVVSGTVDGVDIAARDHAESHTVASHSDTTATGAELETLTDGSNADSLHAHSGGGGGSVLSAIKSVDEVETTSTLQNDDHLFLSLSADTSYYVKLVVSFTQVGNNGDPKFGFTFPATWTIAISYDGSEDGGYAAGRITASGDNGDFFGANNGASHVVNFDGIVNTAGGAGTLQFQFSMNAGGTNTTALAKSFMRVEAF